MAYHRSYGKDHVEIAGALINLGATLEAKGRAGGEPIEVGGSR